MTLYEYQMMASRTEKLLPLESALQHGLMGIMSESGELADTIKRTVIYNQPLDVENIREELGDILWYVAVIANNLDLNLSEVAEENIAKLKVRYPQRYSDAAAAERADK